MAVTGSILGVLDEQTGSTRCTLRRECELTGDRGSNVEFSGGRGVESCITQGDAGEFFVKERRGDQWGGEEAWGFLGQHSMPIAQKDPLSPFPNASLGKGQDLQINLVED